MTLEFKRELTREYMEEVIREWQTVLGLTHWTIIVDWDTPAAEDNYADVAPKDSYDEATIKLSADWPSWSFDFATKTLIHELLHLTTRDLLTAATAVEDVLPASAWKLFEDRFTHELEGVVDRIALTLVDLRRVTSSAPGAPA